MVRRRCFFAAIFVLHGTKRFSSVVFFVRFGIFFPRAMCLVVVGVRGENTTGEIVEVRMSYTYLETSLESVLGTTQPGC